MVLSRIFGNHHIRAVTPADVESAPAPDAGMERQLNAGSELLRSYVGRASSNAAEIQRKMAAAAAMALRR